MNPNFDLSTAEGLDNAVAWQTKLVNVLKEGGYWVVPRSMTVYRLNHQRRRRRRLETGLGHWGGSTGSYPFPPVWTVPRRVGWTRNQRRAGSR